MRRREERKGYEIGCKKTDKQERIEAKEEIQKREEAAELGRNEIVGEGK